MLGIPVGLLYANAVEWLAHRYVLHGLGRKKGSLWSFHWSNHHRVARANEMRDPDYMKGFLGGESKKELVAVGALMLAHAPLLLVAPYFTATVWYSGANYLYRHRKSHVDLAWGRKHMPHHYDHHMGKNQDSNWCVTRPWFDYVMGTRVPYAFTVQEKLPSWLLPTKDTPAANDVEPVRDDKGAVA